MRNSEKITGQSPDRSWPSDLVRLIDCCLDNRVRFWRLLALLCAVLLLIGAVAKLAVAVGVPALLADLAARR